MPERNRGGRPVGVTVGPYQRDQVTEVVTELRRRGYSVTGIARALRLFYSQVAPLVRDVTCEGRAVGTPPAELVADMLGFDLYDGDGSDDDMDSEIVRRACQAHLADLQKAYMKIGVPRSLALT
jgi:hypothetical protein